VATIQVQNHLVQTAAVVVVSNWLITKTSTGKLLAAKRSYFPVILSVRLL
jgi:hypothetical protein